MTLFGILLFGLILVGGLAVIMPLYSATFLLDMPMDCEMGKTCFIQNYVDLDASNKVLDYRCGPLSYDGHKGTDIRLVNLAQMREGVKVLAATDGKVLGIRDGMPDRNAKHFPRESIKDKECGNGVLIEHATGMHIQYCHMMLSSIAVKAGDRVKSGENLGKVGLSGMTEFPHLHLEIRNAKGETIDPYVGAISQAACGKSTRNLWKPNIRKAMDYVATGVLQHGFTDRVPTVDAVRMGKHALDSIKPDAGALVFWAEMFGIRTGDVVTSLVTDASGEVIVHYSQTLDRDKAVYFQMAGKRRQEALWKTGTYTAHLTVRRKTDKTNWLEIDQFYKVVVTGE